MDILVLSNPARKLAAGCGHKSLNIFPLNTQKNLKCLRPRLGHALRRRRTALRPPSFESCRRRKAKQNRSLRFGFVAFSSGGRIRTCDQCVTCSSILSYGHGLYLCRVRLATNLGTLVSSLYGAPDFRRVPSVLAYPHHADLAFTDIPKSSSWSFPQELPRSTAHCSTTELHRNIFTKNTLSQFSRTLTCARTALLEIVFAGFAKKASCACASPAGDTPSSKPAWFPALWDWLTTELHRSLRYNPKNF